VRSVADGDGLLTDLEADEAGQGDAGGVHDLLDGLLVVRHGRLIEQAGVLEVALETTLDDVRDDLLRLALFTGGGGGDLPLLVLGLLGDLVLVEELGLQSGD
jgi:hypothetical protein